MQKPGHKVDLAKTDAEVRLTTGLDEATQQELQVKTKGEVTTQQEFRISTQTDMEVGLDDGYSPDRLLDQNTDTHTGTGTSTSASTSTQSDTRHKTASGELSSLEKHHDPDGTMGCNTCQEDLVDAIADNNRINVGDIIASRYEIKTYLGEGGMSAVYAAVDKVIKRDVALKILHRDLLVRGKGSLLRFQREAQALGNLDHPNIVKIHHFDADENAQPYIVMDIVKGDSLARRLVKEPETVKFTDIIDIFVQVCDALAHAHARGVVHRDLKPSNIMVVGNQVKVLDFGIAKLMSEDSDQELQLTRTGEVFGSPLYMSPEQCRGLKLDFRSDIYSIGCVMYEAFTGNPPFTGNSHIDTMLKHVNDLPASVVASMCDARYAEKVDAILLRCMAKNPNARFQSMDEVKAALLELERETKGPLERLKRKLELIRLKIGAQGKFTKKMIAAYCAAGLIVTGIGTAALLQHGPESYQVLSKDASIERWKELNEQGQVDFNVGKFAQSEAVFNAELEMARKLGNKQLKLSSCNELLDLFNAQLILNPALANDSKFKEKKAKVEQEIAQLDKEQLADIQSLKKEMQSIGAKPNSEREAFCERGIDLGLAATEKGHHQESIGLLKDVLTVAEKTGNRALTAKAHYSLGRAYTNNRNEAEARMEFADSLKIRQEVLPKDDFDTARSFSGLASVLGPKEAGPLLERAREISARAFSPNSHQVGFAEMLMAFQAMTSGQYELSRQKAEAAISKCKNSLETQLSVEEQQRAKQTLVRALIYRGKSNETLLSAQKGRVTDREERENAIRNDYSTALKYTEELNPRPSAHEIDSLEVWLLGQDGREILRKYNLSKSPDSLPRDAAGHPLMLNEARAKVARALAMNERLPATERDRKGAEWCREMGKIARALNDFPLAESMFRKAKQLSDKIVGPNDKYSLETQAELEATIRDAGKTAKK